MEKQSLADNKANTIARIKAKGNSFEILVDTLKAVEYKKNKTGNIQNILIFDSVFRDYKKGIRAGTDELETSFGTSDVYKAAQKILLDGEILLPMELRSKAREDKLKQIVDWLAKSCINPQTNLPHPPQRIMAAINEVGLKVEENKPADAQAMQAMKLIQKILPIKIEVKRLAVKVLPQHSGKVYGVLKEFMIKEEWLPDGSLSCLLEVPQASLTSFYDKLNAVTHGTSIVTEMQK